MKILYVKCNSERAREFQLQTIIYENGGLKYVKKQALCNLAIPHLKKMKENYDKLSSSILNPRIKLAKIINEEDDSLTFEFVDGVSLERMFYDSNAFGADRTDKIIEIYMELLKTGFKTTVFNSSTMIDDVYKGVFGDFDYSELDGKICFDGISNIDLILSNIILNEKNLYLFDYEWVFELNIPIDYIAFRNSHEYGEIFRKQHNALFAEMEKKFIGETVVKKNGFFNVQDNYMKTRLDIFQQNIDKDLQVKHWYDVAQSLRIKNRIKRIVKRISLQNAKKS